MVGCHSELEKCAFISSITSTDKSQISEKTAMFKPVWEPEDTRVRCVVSIFVMSIIKYCMVRKVMSFVLLRATEQ
jgi:hypothetical protein